MRGTLVGKIYPERGGFFLGGTVKSTASLNGRLASALIDIKASIVAVTMLDDIEPTELATYRNNVQAQVRKFANYAALRTGAYHFVLLENFVDGASGEILILPNHEPLETFQLGEKLTVDLDFAIVDTPAVAHALEAYSKALREHDFTAKYALEAIEAVREYWGEGKWEEMRTALNMNQATLTRHQKAATDQKHGRNSVQSWDQRRDQLLIAKEAISRLVAHIRSGSALPFDQHPQY